MTAPTAAAHTAPHDGLVELEETIHSGGFWRLVPESAPRVYAPVDRELLDHAETCLRRLMALAKQRENNRRPDGGSR